MAAIGALPSDSVSEHVCPLPKIVLSRALQRLRQNEPVFGFGGAAVARGPNTQGPHDLFWDIANRKTSHSL